jgi:hypothetical protein
MEEPGDNKHPDGLRRRPSPAEIMHTLLGPAGSEEAVAFDR